jgi:CRP-like cAMP-binding protein
MMSNARSSANPIVRKLSLSRPLTDDETAAIENLPMHVMEIRAGQDIVREGDRPSRACALLDGFAFTYKSTPKGKRQIMSFHVPGDLPDLQSLHLHVLDNSLSTLNACKVGFVPHEALRILCNNHPRLAASLWRETLIDAAIFREWLVNIGRREGVSRMAHLLCEFTTRLKAVAGHADEEIHLPMTQSQLGDATGLSSVHTNRVLQALRREGAISLKGTRLTILDWNKLREIGQFEPSYLHLTEESSAA